jgi:Ca2+/Na+ antiporter
MKTILNFLQSKTNESLKRLIAIMFAITLIVIYFFTNDAEIKKLLIYCYSVLIALLLSLATAETIISLFKKNN